MNCELIQTTPLWNAQEEYIRMVLVFLKDWIIHFGYLMMYVYEFIYSIGTISGNQILEEYNHLNKYELTCLFSGIIGIFITIGLYKKIILFYLEEEEHKTQNTENKILNNTFSYHYEKVNSRLSRIDKQLSRVVKILYEDGYDFEKDDLYISSDESSDSCISDFEVSSEIESDSELNYILSHKM
jgi:hypothetical protein